MKKRRIQPLGYIYLIFVLLLLYVPIFIITLQSFNGSVDGVTFSSLTLKWYKGVLNDQSLREAIFYTFSISILATIFSVFFGTFIAIGINSMKRRGRRNLILMNNVPILNADIVTGVCLFFIFKFVGYLIGIEYILGFWTLLIAHIFFCLPYVILSVLPKLSEINSNIYDAALDLGCKKRKALVKVVIPSIKTGILAGAVLAFAMSFDDFVISYLVAGEEVKNFSMWFYARQRATRTEAWQKAYAYNTIISFLAIAGLVIYCVMKMRKTKNKMEEKYEKDV